MCTSLQSINFRRANHYLCNYVCLSLLCLIQRESFQSDESADFLLTPLSVSALRFGSYNGRLLLWPGSGVLLLLERFDGGGNFETSHFLPWETFIYCGKAKTGTRNWVGNVVASTIPISGPAYAEHTLLKSLDRGHNGLIALIQFKISTMAWPRYRSCTVVCARLAPLQTIPVPSVLLIGHQPSHLMLTNLVPHLESLATRVVIVQRSSPQVISKCRQPAHEVSTCDLCIPHPKYGMRHRFCSSRLERPASGHLGTPVPRTRRKICRYPWWRRRLQLQALRQIGYRPS